MKMYKQAMLQWKDPLARVNRKLNQARQNCSCFGKETDSGTMVQLGFGGAVPSLSVSGSLVPDHPYQAEIGTWSSSSASFQFSVLATTEL